MLFPLQGRRDLPGRRFDIVNDPQGSSATILERAVSPCSPLGRDAPDQALQRPDCRHSATALWFPQQGITLASEFPVVPRRRLQGRSAAPCSPNTLLFLRKVFRHATCIGRTAFFAGSRIGSALVRRSELGKRNAATAVCQPLPEMRRRAASCAQTVGRSVVQPRPIPLSVQVAGVLLDRQSASRGRQFDTIWLIRWTYRWFHRSHRCRRGIWSFHHTPGEGRKRRDSGCAQSKSVGHAVRRDS